MTRVVRHLSLGLFLIGLLIMTVGCATVAPVTATPAPAPDAFHHYRGKPPCTVCSVLVDA